MGELAPIAPDEPREQLGCTEFAHVHIHEKDKANGQHSTRETLSYLRSLDLTHAMLSPHGSKPEWPLAMRARKPKLITCALGLGVNF